MAQKGETIVRFENVSFEHGPKKPILDEVSFGIRRGSKITLMGQNGVGKSTLFHLITGALSPEDGDIHQAPRLSIALSRQVMSRECLTDTVQEFFEKSFPGVRLNKSRNHLEALLSVSTGQSAAAYMVLPAGLFEIKCMILILK